MSIAHSENARKLVHHIPYFFSLLKFLVVDRNAFSIVLNIRFLLRKANVTFNNSSQKARFKSA